MKKQESNASQNNLTWVQVAVITVENNIVTRKSNESGKSVKKT